MHRLNYVVSIGQTERSDDRGIYSTSKETKRKTKDIYSTSKEAKKNERKGKTKDIYEINHVGTNKEKSDKYIHITPDKEERQNNL
jgi:competence protein ComGF